MPTYEYRCSDCTNEFEIVQKFSDAALTECTAVAKESTKESSGAKESTSSDTASTTKASKPDKASKTASTTSTPAA